MLFFIIMDIDTDGVFHMYLLIGSQEACLVLNQTIGLSRAVLSTQQWFVLFKIGVR